MDMISEVDTPDDRCQLITESVDDKVGKFSWRTFIKFVGPGWLMSLAFIDPGNMEADLQMGAFTSFKFAWAMLAVHVMGLLIQNFASKLGVVSGKSLATVCRDRYPTGMNWLLWFMTEMAIIGADIQEVVGSSIALNVLLGVPLWMGCILTAGMTVFFLVLYHLRGMKLIEYFVVLMVCVIFVCFSINFTATRPSLSSLLEGLLIPRLPSGMTETTQIVALIGSVVMPHNLYLHSNLIARKNFNRSSPWCIIQGIKYFFIDSVFALTFSFLINIALEGSFAQGFFSLHCASNPGAPLGCDPSVISPDLSICKLSDCACTTPSGLMGFCGTIGLSNAGSSLAAILPQSSAILFGLGLLAAGQASTLSGTMAGQYVMEGFLELRIPFWLRMIITRSVALVPAIAVSLMQFEFQQMDNLNQFINVLQSVQLPFALLPLLHFASDPQVMSLWAVSGFQRLIGWVLAIGLIGVNVFLVKQRYDVLTDHFAQLVCVCVAACYVLILIYIVREDIRQFLRFLTGRTSPPFTPIMSTAASGPSYYRKLS
jgi:NRAMP (natural resistance-associated macrophage protein)-like metal ion transporter